MSRYADNTSTCALIRIVLATLLGTTATFWSASAEQSGAPAIPNFAPNPDVGWINYNTDFIPPTSGPRPVSNDPAYPFSEGGLPDPFVNDPDETKRRAGQATWRIADLNNPILQPWAREALRKRNEEILAGKPGYSRNVTCWPMGVPGFLLYGVQPVYFIQTPKDVWMIWQNDHQVRHISLNVPHSARQKPSWYGESMGHYEGDTLIVDTIGMNDQTYVDNYRTPHTNQLHVIEQFRMIDGGITLEVNVHVEDPGTFTTPWNAIQCYRRFEPGPLIEVACAENNINPFHQDIEPLPQANKPDF